MASHQINMAVNSTYEDDYQWIQYFVDMQPSNFDFDRAQRKEAEEKYYNYVKKHMPQERDITEYVMAWEFGGKYPDQHNYQAPTEPAVYHHNYQNQAVPEPAQEMDVVEQEPTPGPSVDQDQPEPESTPIMKTRGRKRKAVTQPKGAKPAKKKEPRVAQGPQRVRSEVKLHFGIQTRQLPSGMWPCEVDNCDKQYLNRSSLITHLLKHGFGAEDWICQFCNARYERRDTNRKSHLKTCLKVHKAQALRNKEE